MDARRRRGVAAATAVALLALAAACVPGVTALSWPLCDAGGQVLCGGSSAGQTCWPRGKHVPAACMLAPP